MQINNETVVRVMTSYPTVGRLIFTKYDIVEYKGSLFEVVSDRTSESPDSDPSAYKMYLGKDYVPAVDIADIVMNRDSNSHLVTVNAMKLLLTKAFYGRSISGEVSKLNAVKDLDINKIDFDSTFELTSNYLTEAKAAGKLPVIIPSNSSTILRSTVYKSNGAVITQELAVFLPDSNGTRDSLLIFFRYIKANIVSDWKCNALGGGLDEEVNFMDGVNIVTNLQSTLTEASKENRLLSTSGYSMKLPGTSNVSPAIGVMYSSVDHELMLDRYHSLRIVIVNKVAGSEFLDSYQYVDIDSHLIQQLVEGKIGGTSKLIKFRIPGTKLGTSENVIVKLNGTNRVTIETSLPGLNLVSITKNSIL